MKSLDWEDTIVALASPPGPAGRGIIRISGGETAAVLGQIVSAANDEPLTKTMVAQRIEGELNLTSNFDHSTHRLPAAIYFWPGTKSYTAQVMAEIHMIGAPPLLETVLGQLTDAGARIAEPGEFTLRAFLAGRIDLLQAEAVLGVIDSDSAAELEIALKQLAGGLSNPLVQLRSELLDLLADLEAGLDFVDDDIEFIEREDLLNRLQSARAIIQQIVDQSDSRAHSDHDPLVVLAGLPNAGKSTLFNSLIGQEQALISNQSGTTRDYLTAVIEHHNHRFKLIDTAGMEAASNAILEQSQTLRGDQLKQADLICWCTAADLDDTARESDEAAFCEMQNQTHISCLRVITKSDLADDIPQPARLMVSRGNLLSLLQLKQEIVGYLQQPANLRHRMLGTTSSRCRENCLQALLAIDQAISGTQNDADADLIAIDIRSTLEELGRMVGAVYTDDLLDRIFSRFCIGK